MYKDLTTTKIMAFFSWSFTMSLVLSCVVVARAQGDPEQSDAQDVVPTILVESSDHPTWLTNYLPAWNQLANDIVRKTGLSLPRQIRIAASTANDSYATVNDVIGIMRYPSEHKTTAVFIHELGHLMITHNLAQRVPQFRDGLLNARAIEAMRRKLKETGESGGPEYRDRLTRNVYFQLYYAFILYFEEQFGDLLASVFLDDPAAMEESINPGYRNFQPGINRALSSAPWEQHIIFFPLAEFVYRRMMQSQPFTADSKWRGLRALYQVIEAELLNAYATRWVERGTTWVRVDNTGQLLLRGYSVTDYLQQLQEKFESKFQSTRPSTPATEEPMSPGRK